MNRVLLLLMLVIICCMACETPMTGKKTPTKGVPIEQADKVAPTSAVSVMVAKYATSPISLDGKLDEDVWKNAAAYPLNLAADKAAEGPLEEKGQVRVAWDDEFLYVGIVYTDSDVYAEGEEDEMMHFSLGDVAELFLKQADSPYYWEMYATPRGKKSTLWFPGRGRFGLPGAINYTSGLQVAAQIDGTLNDWTDKDKSWSAEMAVPVKDLTAYGADFGPDSDWRILVARYNYSTGLSVIGPEYSMTPALSRTFFHLTDEYAVLKLEK